MKLLFENWRQYLYEASQTLESMPDDVFIEIVKNPDSANAYMIDLIQGKERVGGSVVEKVDARMTDKEILDLEDRFSEEGRLEELDACDAEWRDFKNLYTLHVEVDPHMKGYGPLLTDLAMELASKDDKWIIPAKLVGGAGTEGARRIYNFYLNKRSDVVKIPIDTKCWEYFTGYSIENLDEVFRYLYTKRPEKLNSQIAKTKIIWIN